MPINRFFIDSPLEKDTSVQLPEEEAKHCKVMRISEGDNVELINGLHILAKGTINFISKKQTKVHITSILKKPPRKQKLILCQSYTKPAKIDWILEKGTELGVDHFVLFKTKHAEKELSSKSERHRGILIASMKQCGRYDLPQIEYTNGLKPMTNTHIFFGDLSEKAPFYPTYIQTLTSNKNIAFINGPESGFTNDETALFTREYGATGVSLHPNVLRTETAAICAMSYSEIYFA